MTARVLRKATEPGPEGFTWRGIKLCPVEGMPQVWRSHAIELDADHASDWRLEQLDGGAWRARLRIGRDHYPGVGKSALEALESAEAEAANVATYIAAMLPAPRELAARDGAGPRPSKRPRRKVRRA